jgi:ATP-dependent Clp protease ATP-binding subunit ClpC
MFERYTEQARRAIFFARFEAIHRRAAAISTAHVLLGLSWDENSRAAVIVSLKDKLADVCVPLGISLRPCTEVPYDQKTDIPLDRNSKMTLAYAANEADWDWQEKIDTDHLLRGLLRFSNEASEALNAISVDLRIVRTASKHNRAEFPPERTPFLRFAQFFFEPIKMALVKLAILVLVCFVGVLIIRWLSY